LDVYHHALTVDVTHFQVRKSGTPESRGIEGHQPCAMQRRASRIDESRHFFLAEDGWQMNGLLRAGCFRNAPGFLERFEVAKAWSRQVLCRRVRRKLSLLKQRGLIFTDVSRALAIQGTVEVSKKIFDGANVTIYGSLGEIAKLEFFQHHFAKSGHGDLL
jgi:hypothetical protein